MIMSRPVVLLFLNDISLTGEWQDWKNKLDKTGRLFRDGGVHTRVDECEWTGVWRQEVGDYQSKKQVGLLPMMVGCPEDTVHQYIPMGWCTLTILVPNFLNDPARVTCRIIARGRRSDDSVSMPGQYVRQAGTNPSDGDFATLVTGSFPPARLLELFTQQIKNALSNFRSIGDSISIEYADFAIQSNFTDSDLIFFCCSIFVAVI